MMEYPEEMMPFAEDDYSDPTAFDYLEDTYPGEHSKKSLTDSKLSTKRSASELCGIVDDVVVNGHGKGDDILDLFFKMIEDDGDYCFELRLWRNEVNPTQ